MKRRLKRLKPLIVVLSIISIIIGLCIYFKINKYILLGILILFCVMGFYFTRAIIENYILKCENDALESELGFNMAIQKHISDEDEFMTIPNGLNMPNKKEYFKDSAKSVNVKLKDVAGCLEAKQEVIEIIDFLKNPEKYHKAGAKLPRGVLFEGPPGTGKTLLAKAIAGEAGVKFLATSGSEFMEMYVGKGAQRVRELFAAAGNEPTLIFIDEIDAVGGKRGVSAGNDTERERTLNQLLVEMDGFHEKQNIVVIAATNRKEMLDKALLRPGRFERHIKIGLPTLEEREQILNVHARNKVFDKTVSLKSLAKKTSSFSGAELASLLNEAALMSVRNNREFINIKDCEEALDRVILGPARKSRRYIEKEKKLVAYHEAGHAVIGLKLNNAQKVERITIVPRGDAGGYNLFSDKEETFFNTKNTILEEIIGLLGGRAAEEILFNDISSGASNDLMKATQLAHAFVCDYGMSELGMIQYSQLNSVSDKMKQAIDDEMNRIIDNCYQKALAILKENRHLLDLIATTLLEKETIDAYEVEALVARV